MARPRKPPKTGDDAAAIDARYGLEPVYEPGGDVGLGDFITVDCPYCGEAYGTPVDLTAGSCTYVEDCQICCQPIELSVSVDDAGRLASFTARRLD